MRIVLLPCSRGISSTGAFCYVIRTHLHFLNGFPFAHQPFADKSFEVLRRGLIAEENEPPMEISIALAELRAATSVLPTSDAHLAIRSWAVRCSWSQLRGSISWDATWIVSGQTVNRNSKPQLPFTNYFLQSTLAFST